MDERIIEIASEVLGITSEEVKTHMKRLDEVSAYYFWNPVRGGFSVIISDDGEKLSATSAVSLEKHMEAFKSGRRN